MSNVNVNVNDSMSITSFLTKKVLVRSSFRSPPNINIRKMSQSENFIITFDIMMSSSSVMMIIVVVVIIIFRTVMMMMIITVDIISVCQMSGRSGSGTNKGTKGGVAAVNGVIVIGIIFLIKSEIKVAAVNAVIIVIVIIIIIKS